MSEEGVGRCWKGVGGVERAYISVGGVGKVLGEALDV